MDLEFYVRGALKLKAPPPPSAPLPPARPLNPQFTMQALEAIEVALSPPLATTPAALRDAAAARRKTLQSEYDRVLYSGAFGSGGYDSAPATPASTAGQYGFDLTLLAYFSLLADARLQRRELSETSLRLGDALLPSVAATPSSSAKLSGLVTGARALLDELRTFGYIGSFSVDDSDVDDGLWAQRSDLSDTRLSITLSDSASLRAAVLLNGRLGASPDLAKPLLVAYLKRSGADVVEVQEFFLDDTYRSDPQDYRANQQIITLLLRPSPK